MKILIRTGILSVIIFLGLTIVAPEWLDLKNMILSDYRASQMDRPYYRTISPKITESPFSFFDTIHQRIAGARAGDRPSGFGAIITFPFWLLHILMLYLIFTTLTIIFYFMIRYVSKRHIRYSLPKQLLYESYSVLFNISFFILSTAIIYGLWS